METTSRETKNSGTATGGMGDVQNVGVLDLTGMKNAEDLARITSISNCGVILVPASLMPSLAGIPIRNSGATVAVPEGERVRLLTGEITLSGESLAAGTKDEVLVAVGQLVITSAVREVGFNQLIVVGELIAPQGSEGAIGAALSGLTGAAVYFPCAPGAEVKIRKGSSNLRGETLENAGGNDTDVLLILGSATIVGPVTAVGYQHIAASGSLFAPNGSQAVLGARLWSSGITAFYKASPRRFPGKERFSKEFFEFLDEPITLIIEGVATIEADVPPELVREKIAEVILRGVVKAPAEVVPVLQVITTEMQGIISPLGNGEEDDQKAQIVDR